MVHPVPGSQQPYNRPPIRIIFPTDKDNAFLRAQLHILYTQRTRLMKSKCSILQIILILPLNYINGVIAIHLSFWITHIFYSGKLTGYWNSWSRDWLTWCPSDRRWRRGRGAGRARGALDHGGEARARQVVHVAVHWARQRLDARGYVGRLLLNMNRLCAVISWNI